MSGFRGGSQGGLSRKQGGSDDNHKNLARGAMKYRRQVRHYPRPHGGGGRGPDFRGLSFFILKGRGEAAPSTTMSSHKKGSKWFKGKTRAAGERRRIWIYDGASRRVPAT